MAKSKMYEGIVNALTLIENGDYTVFNGELFNKQGKKVGSLDKASGSIFYVIKGIDIIAQRLMFAVYHGAVSLKEGEGIHHLDGDKTNNLEGNLVQLPRKGHKQALTALRVGLACPLQLQAITTATPQEPTPLEGVELVNAIKADLAEGTHSIKDIANKYGVKYKRVYDIKKKM
jgi:hypothetical protein